MILRYYFCMTAETLSIIAEVSELTFSGHIRYFIYVVWIFSKMLSIVTESLKFENQISGSKLFSVNLFRTNSGLWFPFLFYSAQKIKFDVKYFFSTQFPLDLFILFKEIPNCLFVGYYIQMKNVKLVQLLSIWYSDLV